MRWIAATAVLVMLAGCATSEPTDAGPEDGSEPGAQALGGTEWVLAEGVPVVAGYPITLRVEDGEVRGTAACNSYSGAVVTTGDELEVGDIAVTEMGCPEPGVHDSEAAYLGALQAVERYEHDEGQLLLFGPGVELRFEAATPVEDEPLTGTDWRLESLVRGSGPDGTVSSTMADATLRLDEDGTMQAFDGCNDLGGRWVLEDDGMLVVSEVITTDVACPSLADQVEHISEVLLEANPVVTVEGSRLVLTAGERALEFRASAARVTVEVFFSNDELGDPSDCGDVFPVSREVPADEPVRGAVQELVAGPTPEEAAQGYGGWFSEDTRDLLRSVEVTDGVARVDFGDLRAVIPNASTSCGSAILLGELDATLGQFPGVEHTRYSLDGDVDAFYEWLQFSAPDDEPAEDGAP